MTYENYKNGMFRVFIVLSIPLELETLVIFWCIYLKSFLIVKPFIGFMGKQ
jgi:hypothetical protein